MIDVMISILSIMILRTIKQNSPNEIVGNWTVATSDESNIYCYS